VSKKISEDTKTQTEKFLNDAKEQIARETVGAEKKLALSTSKLAITFLEKTAKELFSTKEQAEVIAQALKKIKKTS
jgi:F0F1-type ATP synthase membrane subunit b/b'